jgi:hypothetical protein
MCEIGNLCGLGKLLQNAAQEQQATDFRPPAAVPAFRLDSLSSSASKTGSAKFATNQQSDLLDLSTNSGVALTTNYMNSPGSIARLARTLFDRVISMGLAGHALAVLPSADGSEMAGP